MDAACRDCHQTQQTLHIAAIAALQTSAANIQMATPAKDTCVEGEYKPRKARQSNSRLTTSSEANATDRLQETDPLKSSAGVIVECYGQHSRYDAPYVLAVC